MSTAHIYPRPSTFPCRSSLLPLRLTFRTRAPDRGMNFSSLMPAEIKDFALQTPVSRFEQHRLHFFANHARPSVVSRVRTSRNSLCETQDLKLNSAKDESGVEGISFAKMKHHFLKFKKNEYMGKLEHFQTLAKAQTPKFMVIACADSRVCPSNILGFEPGDAFVVRNVANLVPPFEKGPSETSAALEYAVSSLGVENILVIGHSCCGGIKALMGMQDDAVESSLVGSWVGIAKNARLGTESSACELSFDEKCRHCEKDSVNNSLVNLLTFPWIEEKVRGSALSLHGGYYDFINCSFEKWTLDYGTYHLKNKPILPMKDRMFWS